MPKRKKSNLWLKKPKQRRFPRFVTPKKRNQNINPKKDSKKLYRHSTKKYDRHCNMRPSQGVGVPVDKGIYFSGAGEQRPHFEGEKEKKRQYWGTGNIRKLRLGEQGNKPNYFRGTREQVPPPPPPTKVVWGPTGKFWVSFVRKAMALASLHI